MCRPIEKKEMYVILDISLHLVVNGLGFQPVTQRHTVNVDIFTCIHFHGYFKMGNFACIENRVFTITASLGYYECNMPM